MLAYWVEEGSVSVLPTEKVISEEKRFGKSCTVQLGRTDYTMKIAGTGKFFHAFVGRM